MTNETKHTPGPWKLDGAANTGDLDIVATTGRITMLDCEISEVSEDVLTANAHLIAAAPELLAALRAAEEWADYIDDDESRVPVDVRLAMRAAIARATGEG